MPQRWPVAPGFQLSVFSVSGFIENHAFAAA